MLPASGFAPPLVVVSEPHLAKQIFSADRTTVRAGDANGGPLLQVVGPGSLLLLDEERHLSCRKMMLPPFHGERMQLYGALMKEITDAEIDRWPLRRPFSVFSSLQAITLRVIVRAVFGISDDGPRLAHIERLLVRYANQGLRPWMPLMAGREQLPRFGPWRPFLRTRTAVHQLIDAEIRRRSSESDLDQRTDILSLLIGARDPDGEGLGVGELRDQLLTLLVAGYETTSTGLAWSIERLLRNPQPIARLLGETEAGEDDAYLGAVVQETLRSRPPIPFVFRYSTEPFQLGDYQAPAESLLVVSISLIHKRPDLYPDPHLFRPERFLEGDLESFSWLPFGGGVRRCLGAPFATYEMRIVLSRILERCELVAPDPRPERPRRRAVTFVPHRGARVELRRRSPAAAEVRRERVGPIGEAGAA